MRPEIYPNKADKVKLIQTHISWIFLVGDRVYKIKKPVNFGFLDFTTVEKRHFYCLEELRLNRRLCPEIYLDCYSIGLEDGKILFNTGEKVIDWAVVMKRMPEEGMMQRLISLEDMDKEKMDIINRKLTPFYKEADAGPEVAQYGNLDVIIQNTEENFDQTRNYIGRLIDPDAYDHICSFTRSFIREHEKLFLARQQQGWIKDGHGDLYSANICFDLPKKDVYIFDCIEFNNRFRCGDVASDVAFLAMDLDFNGLLPLSRYFMDRFADMTRDPDLLKLSRFYMCYRAYVRGKIGCFTWSDETVDRATRDKAKEQAGDYFRLALWYAGGLRSGDIYCFFGLSGTGKSTLAESFARRHGLPVFNSDRIRKEMVARVPATQRHLEAYGKGIYGKQFTRKTYSALLRSAAKRIVTGRSVVLDATYIDAMERQRLLELSKEAGSNIHFILCKCPEEEVKRRLNSRIREDGQVSDGRWEIYIRQKKAFSPPSGTLKRHLIEIDTNRQIEEILDEIDRHIGPVGN